MIADMFELPNHLLNLLPHPINNVLYTKVKLVNNAIKDEIGHSAQNFLNTGSIQHLGFTDRERRNNLNYLRPSSYPLP